MVSRKEQIDTQTFSNDSTSKQLGFTYQHLIALEKCLDAKPNQSIWIECKGDVADDVSTVEVKHHISSHNITDNSIDVWKTLKNYVEEKNTAQSFTQLILHTTSTIAGTSIFSQWKELSTIEKRKALLSHKPVASIKEFHDKLVSCSREDLDSILERFEIISDQPNVKEKWEELKEHSTFTTIPLNLKEQALQVLLGYIVKQAIDNPNMWKVDINDFRRDIRHAISKFVGSSIPFYYVSETDIPSEPSKEELIFVNKMKEIKLKQKNLEIAVSDYFRAQKSQVTMLFTSPILAGNLDRYDCNLKRDLDNEKLSRSDGLDEKDIDTEKADGESRSLYFECIRKPVTKIVGVKDVGEYYKAGRIHHIVDEGNFEWKYKEGDV
jgi:hypothetical protein